MRISQFKVGLLLVILFSSAFFIFSGYLYVKCPHILPDWIFIISAGLFLAVLISVSWLWKSTDEQFDILLKDMDATNNILQNSIKAYCRMLEIIDYGKYTEEQKEEILKLKSRIDDDAITLYIRSITAIRLLNYIAQVEYENDPSTIKDKPN